MIDYFLEPIEWDPRAIIHRARGIIAGEFDGLSWGKHRMLVSDSPTSATVCAYGALLAAHVGLQNFGDCLSFPEGHDDRVHTILTQNRVTTLIMWNDRMERTHGEVLALFNRLAQV